MASKLFLKFILISSLCFSLGFSEMTPESLNTILTQASGTVGGLLNSAAVNLNDAPNMPCVQKLLPCQPYLHSPTQPPATCCVPLSEMIGNEIQCLCSVLGNPAILQSLNITKDDALNLAKSCGAKADISLCKNATSPTASPATPTPTTPSTPVSSNSSSSTATSPPQSAAYRTLYNGRLGLVVAFFAGLIFLAV